MQHTARTQSPVTDDLVRDIAGEADCDERTVVRRLAGLPVRTRVCARIDRAIQSRQLVQR